MDKFFGVLGLLCGLFVGGSFAHAAVSDTVHNLSTTGPGNIRATGVGDVCVFCHTPHRAAQTQALWNRELPPLTYKLYESSTMEANLQQPTGASRLCLSCHDGTTALGNLRVPPAHGRVNLGPLTGRESLGTDLSDDHPISFVYDTQLSLRNRQIANPITVSSILPLDMNNQMQCTSCHDPHSDRNRKFLRLDDRAAALCTICHKEKDWAGSTHANSPATWRGTGADPFADSPYKTVLDNGCRSCHRSHAAPRPPRLLSNDQESGVCLVCHNGSVANKNLEPEFLKSSAHPVTSTNWIHDPLEDPNTMPRHVACVDCHNPHQTISTVASPPNTPGPLQGVKAVNISGARIGAALDEYEICLKCHGIKEPTSTGIVRSDNTRNIRLKIDPGNSSYHPIPTVGKHAGIQGLEPPYNPASIIYCTDCHNNDEWTSGGTAARGPHGSRYAPLLEREYQVNDPATENFQTYALCYKCHNRNFLINDQAQTFPHKKHVVEERSSCAACHDAHGSRQNVSLINFMQRDKTGKTIVTPSQNQKRLEFISLGRGRGQCYLVCHGKNHEPESYP